MKNKIVANSIKTALKTLKFILQQKGIVCAITYMGKPKLID